MSSPQLRQPLQQRSRASHLRVIQATEDLLRTRGDGDFTLAEISTTASVSIGSIYHFFGAKEALIQAIQRQVLDEILARLDALIDSAGEAQTLPSVVAGLVDGLAETSRQHAPILRPLILCANSDPRLAQGARRAYQAVARRVSRVLLTRRASITHPDPDRATIAMFRLIHGAIARTLAFGEAPSAGRAVVSPRGWLAMKEDLTAMATGFLLTRPACAVCWRSEPDA